MGHRVPGGVQTCVRFFAAACLAVVETSAAESSQPRGAYQEELKVSARDGTSVPSDRYEALGSGGPSYRTAPTRDHRNYEELKASVKAMRDRERERYEALRSGKTVDWTLEPRNEPPVIGSCLANHSFETGDFTAWVTRDLDDPFFALQVGGAGLTPGHGFFESSPTDGAFAALHGWDARVPGTIVIAQDMVVPVDATTLSFDYRAAWNMTVGEPATQDRTFEMVIRPACGGSPLQTELLLTAGAGTIVLDTGDLLGAVDVSAFAGQAIRVSFEWLVPEHRTGPAFFQLDNVRCKEGPVPECADNASFETGGFPPWAMQDLAATLFPLQVGTACATPGFGFFESSPTDGAFAALHGWDGDGPGTVVIEQDIVVPVDAMAISFDYRAAWDMSLGAPATQDRTFEVVIRPAGGGSPLQTELILTAEAGTIVLDTGDLLGEVDVSAFAEQAIRVSFEWFVPEFFTGPAFFQLDNVRCQTALPVCVLLDADGDGDIDLLDYARFQECFTGPQ